MVDSITKEQQVHSGGINDNDDSSIEEIDNHGCLLQDEEKIQTPNVSDGFCENSVIRKTFANLDIAYDFYNQYGLSKGFGIRKHHLSKHTGTHTIYRRQFVCNKQGFKDMNDKRHLRDGVKRRVNTRTGCKAMMQVTLSKQEEWVVDKFDDEHNHPLDPPSQVLKQRSHNSFHRSQECKDLIVSLMKSGKKPCEFTKVVNVCNGNDEDNLIPVQCSSIVSSKRKINLGKECYGIVTHFKDKAELDKDFYFSMDLSSDGTIKNVFWADERSRSSYNQFGDVVVFDTYKTNKFSFPFVSFVGVNHHNQFILFGAALLEDENEAAFTWLFKQFLKCMYDCPPVSIITDQDLTMCKAIAKVFPKTRHRFSAWHIQKHVLEHLQPLRSPYHNFQDEYVRWIKSQTIKEFECGWEDLKEKYHIEDDTWLGNMYKLRRHWVKTYLKDTFFAGMTSSGRSENIHSFFDCFVNSDTLLNDFVHQHDQAVSSRRAAEEDQNFRTLNAKPMLYSNHPIEATASECYTPNLYEIFKKQWKASFNCGHEKLSKEVNLVKYRVGYLKGNKENWKCVEYRKTSSFVASCSCAKFENVGILCKHILYIMRRKLVTSIPSHYVLPRWTINAKYKVGSIGFGWKGIEEVSSLKLWSIRSKFNKALEEARDSPYEIEKLNTLLSDFLEEQNRRKKIQVDLSSNTSCSIPTPSQKDTSQHISVCDSTVPDKTKGRPKVSTSINSSTEMVTDSKKRNTCSYCKGEGHNTTGYQKRKMDKSQNDDTVEVTCDLTNNQKPSNAKSGPDPESSPC